MLRGKFLTMMDVMAGSQRGAEEPDTEFADVLDVIGLAQSADGVSSRSFIHFSMGFSASFSASFSERIVASVSRSNSTVTFFPSS